MAGNESPLHFLFDQHKYSYEGRNNHHKVTDCVPCNYQHRQNGIEIMEVLDNNYI